MKYEIEKYDPKYWMLIDTVCSPELEEYHKLAFNVLRKMTYNTHEQYDLNMLRNIFYGNLKKYRSVRIGDRVTLYNPGKQYTIYQGLFGKLGIDDGTNKSEAYNTKHEQQQGFSGVVREVILMPDERNEIIVYFEDGIKQKCVTEYTGILKNPMNVDIW